MNETPAVWIGCVGCYNAGHLVGEWVDIDEARTYADMDDWVKLVGKTISWRRALSLHEAEQHEELWCFDTERLGDLIKGEGSPSHAAEVWELVKDFDEDQRQALGAWASNHSESIDTESIPRFEDQYCGRWGSEADYAQDFIYETQDRDGAVDFTTWPFNCIDWDEAAEELFGSDYESYPASGGDVFVVRTH